MAYYSSPEEMFLTRAINFKRSGNRHWAMAKMEKIDTIMVMPKFALPRNTTIEQELLTQRKLGQLGDARNNPLQ